MKSGPLKFGLVGFGAWGRCHANAIAKTKRCGARGDQCAERGKSRGGHGVVSKRAVFADYRELLARDDIELVDIVVPSNLHHEIASAALKAGKHVLLEKPMALSLDECDDLTSYGSRGKTDLRGWA